VVVPALLDPGLRAPTAADLPESLCALASLHAVTLSGEDLDIEIDNLVQSVERGRSRRQGQLSE
jgi:hypothetical protein